MFYVRKTTRKKPEKNQKKNLNHLKLEYNLTGSQVKNKESRELMIL